MEETFGARLQRARKQAGFRTQTDLGDAVGKSGKTIRNWETDRHMPDAADRLTLRRYLGEFDADGDPVEVALRASALDGFRQTKVIGYYQEQLHQQRLEQGA